MKQVSTEKKPKVHVRVGLIQIAAKKCNLAYNQTRSLAMIRKAAKKGAQIVCMPECMLDGYSFDSKEFIQHPENYCASKSGPWLPPYLQLAQELQIYIILTLSLDEGNRVYRNAPLLISPKGMIEGEFHKVHSTHGNPEATFYTHGTDFPVFHVEFNGIPCTIGIMICYDRQMPESARILAIRGAEIIFNPAATANFAARWNTHLLQTRAYENECFIVSLNYAFPRINGRSFVLNPKGRILTRCGFWECVRVLTLKLEEVRSQSKHLETRRPSIYQGLLEPTVSRNP